MTTQDFPAVSGSLAEQAPFWRRRTGMVVTSAALVAAVFGGVTGGVVGALNAPSAAVAPASSSPVALNASSTVDVSDVAARVLPSVVQVNVASAQGQGLGSGVVLTADGR